MESPTHNPAEAVTAIVEVQDFLLEEINLLRKAMLQQIQVARDELHGSMLQQIQACKDECFASAQKQVQLEVMSYKDDILHEVHTCREDCSSKVHDVRSLVFQHARVNSQDSRVLDTASLYLELQASKQVLHHVQAEVAALQNAEGLKQFQLEDDPQEHAEPYDLAELPPEESQPHKEKGPHAVTQLAKESHQASSPEGEMDYVHRSILEPATTDCHHPTTTTEKSLGSFPPHAAYKLAESVWDYTLLIGLPDMGLLGSTCTLFLLLLNIFVQLSLCFIINDTFTVNVIDTDTLESLRGWRAMYGHSWQYANEFTWQPLVDDICNFRGAVPVATEAALILDTVEQYVPSELYYDYQQPVIGPLLPYMHNIGVYLSAICILIWILCVLREFEDMWDSLIAIAHFPTRVTKVHYFKRSSIVDSLSIGRKLLFYYVVMTRFFVVVLLGFAGIFYIINTIAMRDLLLNCSALAIVLEMDELLATCIPAQSQRLLKSIEPLPRPSSTSVMGLSLSSVSKLIVATTVVVLSILKLSSDADLLEDGREALCGGRRGFVAAADATGVVVASDSPPHKDLTSTYHYAAMNQLIWGDGFVDGILGKVDMSSSSTSVIGSDWSLETWVSQSAHETIDYWNRDCLDMLPTDSYHKDYGVQFARILRDAIGRDFQSCVEVRPWCSNDDFMGMRARQVCPLTCGCATADYSLVLTGDSGCPGPCLSLSTYNASTWSRECTDLDDTSTVFRQYAHSLENIMRSSFPAMYNQSTVDLVKDSGCGIVSMELSIFNNIWSNLCEVSDAHRLKPFTYACPVTCNCSTNPRYLCPKQCHKGLAR